MFRCCRSSSQQQRVTRVNDNKTTNQQRSKNKKLNDDVGHDLLAVKSWREQRRTTTTTTTPDGTAVMSTALVVHDSNKKNNHNNKLATIEEQSHEKSYCINTSLSSAPQLVMDDTEQQTSYIDHIPQQQQEQEPLPPGGDPSSPRDVGATSDEEGRSYPKHYNFKYDGSFPTLTEEAWRMEQQLLMMLHEQEQQDEYYLSSSSYSTIEDPIMIIHPYSYNIDINGSSQKKKDYVFNTAQSAGPIDLDSSEMNDNDNDKNVFVHGHKAFTKRPEPDDDSDRAVIAGKNNHRTNAIIVQELSTEQQDLVQPSSTISSYASILRDKEPEFDSIINSTESKELDTMIAAIDSSGSSMSFGTATVKTKVTPRTAVVSVPSTSSRELDSRSSPYFHAIASQQSTILSKQNHIIIGAGSTYTAGGASSSHHITQLSPNQRDSPSVCDPKSYMVAEDHYSNMVGKDEEAGPTLVSPPSDGISIDPSSRTDNKTSSKTRIGRDRHRSTQKQLSPSDNNNNNNNNNNIHRKIATSNIPETAQERRKARSQSRGRRIRERAQSLLSTYNCQPVNRHHHLEFLPIPSEDNYSTSTANNNNYHVETHGATRSLLTKLEDESGSITTFAASNLSNDVAKRNDRNILEFETQQPTSLTQTTVLTEPESWIGGKVVTTVGDLDLDVFKNEKNNSKNKNNVIMENLSDFPSEVDPLVRAKYLKACQILKSSLLDKNPGIHPSDREFVTQMLEMSLAKDEEHHTNDTPKLIEGAIKQYETTRKSISPDILQEQRSTPLFDTATSICSDRDFSNAQRTTSINEQQQKSNSSLHAVVPGESSGVTEQELQIHNRIYMMNQQPRHATAFPERNTVTPSETQVSSFVFSSSNDDYPYKVLSTDIDFRPTVLLPGMMSALRGFFPLNVCEYHFCHKYSLRRETNINTSNIMELLYKVQGCKYTIICVETVDGSVFGTFCTTPWQMQSSWYGSGESSFLWRLKNQRISDDGTSTNDNVDLGSNEIEIYPYTGSDTYIQYCTNQTMAVGGGTDWTNTKEGYSPYQYEPGTGIGFLIDGDLLGGETNSCVTYANPRLDHPPSAIVSSSSKPLTTFMNNESNHNDGRFIEQQEEGGQPLDTSMVGNEFDVKTFEVYTLTKYATVDKAKASFP
jgi:hypothetical protein